MREGATLSVLLGIAVLLATRSVGAGFDEGVAAYERGDFATALREFQPLAAGGDANAQFIVGLMYDTGRGVPEQPARAAVWYRRAAELGDAAAQYNLALLYDHGRGVAEDPVEAASWYRLAAENGLVDAQAHLGELLEEGRGITQDLVEARKWYRLAAEWGRARAQFRLGAMYENGSGVAVDPSEAAGWYRRAAEQGHPAAQFNLGLMYHTGRGVPEDEREAEKWYRRAAEQGDGAAQYNLGVLYAQPRGKGVEEDAAEAYLWFSLAAAQGDADAAKSRDTVRGWLSERQRKRVQARIREHTAGQRLLGQPAASSRRVATDTALVRDIQHALAEKGYNPGPADGIVGQRTRAAIREFQRRLRLPLTGEPSAALLRLIRSR